MIASPHNNDLSTVHLAIPSCRIRCVRSYIDVTPYDRHCAHLSAFISKIHLYFDTYTHFDTIFFYPNVYMFTLPAHVRTHAFISRRQIWVPASDYFRDKNLFKK